jgi:putative endopeptidase
MNSLPRAVCLPALVAAIVVAGGCAQTPTRTAPVAKPEPVAAAPAKPDVVAANIDPSVNPGDDFFAYANGTWLKNHPIPASESNWGIGKAVNEELYGTLRSISEQSAADANAVPGSDAQKIGDFWQTAMDDALADRLGLQPIQDELARIDAAKNLQQVLDVAFELKPLGVDAFFDGSVYQDLKRSDTMALYLSQGGLGLPERDYYFNTEAGVAKARTAYVAHLHNLLRLLGEDDAAAAANAQKIMTFETALAKVSRKLADLRDPQRNYNKMAPATLAKKYTPAIAWPERLHALNVDTPYVIVGQPEFFAGLQAQLKKTPVPVLRDYLRAHLADTYADYLAKEIDAEHFDFYGRVLSGQKEQRARWKRVLDAENQALGMILGRIFVKEYFPETAKQRYNTLVEAIRTAYGERIDRLDWMSAETKAKAHEKLAAVTKKVGYPDKWKDYSTLTIGRDSYAQNMMRAEHWRFADRLAKVGKPVDRSEWGMTPQTYNAYYNPTSNEIVLPAAAFAIPGMRDAEIDDAVIYGYAAGSTIGHELTHGFDDEGRQFDAVGNLAEWWTPDDAKKFTARADEMVKQFDAYEPLPGLHINGRASLGENIADYGGMLIALDAFKKTEQYKKGEKVSGYTPMQRFFLGYALSWLFQQQDEELRRHLLSDVHAPPKWRVLGPLSNMPEFYDAFGVKPGQAMWRAESDRVRIW